MQNSEIISGDYTGIAATGYGSKGYLAGINVPKGSFADSFFLVHHIGGGNTFSNKIGHFIILGSSQTNSTHIGRWHNPVIEASSAYQIDKKLDDGKPYTGKVMDINGSSYTPNCATSNDINTGKYNLTDDTKTCLVMFQYD